MAGFGRLWLLNQVQKNVTVLVSETAHGWGASQMVRWHREVGSSGARVEEWCGGLRSLPPTRNSSYCAFNMYDYASFCTHIHHCDLSAYLLCSLGAY